MLSSIVAIANKNAIGKDNKLMWHISEDLKYFKRITLGHTVIMGYKTFVSIGSKPLPNRRNIVLTSRKQEGAYDGVEYFSSMDSAIKAASIGDNEPFIIGGGLLYKASMPYVDKLYITEVDLELEGADVFFPEVDLEIWKQETRSELMEDPKTGHKYSFVTYIKK